MIKSKLLIAASIALASLSMAGCQSDATTASNNLSTASDNFEVDRKIVFYNGITGDYMLVIQGKCSIEPSPTKLEVTCKTGFDNGKAAYKKHYLGLSDNVTYFAQQLEGVPVDVFHNRIIFKPESILPDIDLRLSTDDMTKSEDGRELTFSDKVEEVQAQKEGSLPIDPKQ